LDFTPGRRSFLEMAFNVLLIAAFGSEEDRDLSQA
jgi:hypothetical protein